MRVFLRVVIPSIILIAIGIYTLLPHPNSDQTTLRAVAAESRILIANNQASPQTRSVDIPKEKWPPAIASLKPYSVTVRPGMVDILVKPYFDGGWGYGFAADKRDLTMLVECWSELGHNIYWHSPC